MARFAHYTEWNAGEQERASGPYNARNARREREFERLFEDPQVRQRVGELISRAMLHSGKASWTD